MCNCHDVSEVKINHSLNESVEKLFDIKSYYILWNKKAFNNELPNNIKFKWSNSMKALGHVVTKHYRLSNKFSIESFNISKRYDFNETQFVRTLLHEMIHVYEATVLNTSPDHKSNFIKKMNELNSRFGYDINIKSFNSPSYNKEKIPNIYVVFITKPEGKFKTAFDNEKGARSFFEMCSSNYRLSEKEVELELVETDSVNKFNNIKLYKTSSKIMYSNEDGFYDKINKKSLAYKKISAGINIPKKIFFVMAAYKDKYILKTFENYKEALTTSRVWLKDYAIKNEIGLSTNERDIKLLLLSFPINKMKKYYNISKIEYFRFQKFK